MLALTVIARAVPDGQTMDAEGAVWIADPAHNRAVRIAEGATILDEISSGSEPVFAVTLGGDAGTTLFLCVAPDSNVAARTAARDARMLATEVAVAHAGRP